MNGALPQKPEILVASDEKEAAAACNRQYVTASGSRPRLRSNGDSVHCSKCSALV
jgi:hypothetical protein